MTGPNPNPDPNSNPNPNPNPNLNVVGDLRNKEILNSFSYVHAVHSEILTSDPSEQWPSGLLTYHCMCSCMYAVVDVFSPILMP